MSQDEKKIKSTFESCIEAGKHITSVWYSIIAHVRYTTAQYSTALLAAEKWSKGNIEYATNYKQQSRNISL